jgi:hypothetical protein
MLAIGMCLVLLFNFSLAENRRVASTYGAYLRIPVGVRQVGMGGAFGGVADEVNTLYWNPAGLGQVDTPQACFVHNRWVMGVNYEYLSLCHPVGQKGTIGYSLSYLDLGTFIKTDEWGVRNGEKFKSFVSIGRLSYGHCFLKEENLLLGGNLKFAQERIDFMGTSLTCVDLAALYKTKWINLGVNLQNLGLTPIERFNLPSNLKIGFARYLYQEEGTSVLAAFDVNKPIDNGFRANLGVEAWYAYFACLRLGYQIGYDLGGPSVGLGIRWRNYRFDYAYLPYQILGNVHQFSVLWEINSKRWVERRYKKFAKELQKEILFFKDESLPVPKGVKIRSYGSLIIIEWEKVLDERIVGFNLYLKEDGTYKRINRQIIKGERLELRAFCSEEGRYFAVSGDKKDLVYFKIEKEGSERTEYCFTLSSVRGKGNPKYESKLSEEVKIRLK